MMQRHSVLRTYTLAEFAVEQRLLRREKLLNRLREEKLEALKLKVSKRASKHFESFVKILIHKFNAAITHLMCFLSTAD